LHVQAESAEQEIPVEQMAELVQIQQQVASMRDALSSDAAAELLGGFADGIQRAQSNAWRPDSTLGGAAGSDTNNSGVAGHGSNQALGAQAVAALSTAIDSLLNSVSLVKPSDGTYSLSASDSPLVVTVENRLRQDVLVQVKIAPAYGVIGFEPPPHEVVTIPAESRKTVSVPTHVERLGQFKVIASLMTPSGEQLGTPVELSLRSTAIGGITKIITIVAASVLVLALARRLIIRTRHHVRNRRPANSVTG
jgi:hypothetical protein